MTKPPSRPILRLWFLGSAKTSDLAGRLLERELVAARIAMQWFQDSDHFLRGSEWLCAEDRPHGVLVWGPWTEPLPWVVAGALAVLGTSSRAPKTSLWFGTTEPPEGIKARTLKGDVPQVAKRLSYGLRHRYNPRVKGAP